MNFLYIGLVLYTTGHLISVTQLQYPVSTTPIHRFSWSIEENLNDLTDLGRRQIKNSAEKLVKTYEDLIEADQTNVFIYTKNSSLGLSMAEAFFKEIPLKAEILTNDSKNDFLLSPEIACERIHWLMLRDRYESKAFTQY